MDKCAELNTLCHREPVELFQKRRGASEFGFFENEPSTSILDSLKAGDLFLRYAIQKGVTIVQPGQDEGTDSVVA